MIPAWQLTKLAQVPRTASNILTTIGVLLILSITAVNLYLGIVCILAWSSFAKNWPRHVEQFIIGEFEKMAKPIAPLAYLATPVAQVPPAKPKVEFVSPRKSRMDSVMAPYIANMSQTCSMENAILDYGIAYGTDLPKQPPPMPNTFTG